MSVVMLDAGSYSSMYVLLNINAYNHVVFCYQTVTTG